MRCEDSVGRKSPLMLLKLRAQPVWGGRDKPEATFVNQTPSTKHEGRHVLTVGLQKWWLFTERRTYTRAADTDYPRPHNPEGGTAHLPSHLDVVTIIP